MKNVTITGDMPELYQESSRPSKDVVLEELKGTSEAFAAFSAEPGDKFAFPVLEKMKFKRQPVTKDGKNYVYFVGCIRTRNGVETKEWFSLNFLGKTDANRVPVNPTWYALGDNKARAEKLAEIGEIHVLKEVKVNTPVFVGGRPNRIPTLDPETGLQKIDETGTALTHVETREQTSYLITPYAPEKSEEKK